MVTYTDTFDYVESLLNNKIKDTVIEIRKWDGEDDPFVDKKSEELKTLYKHLENLQKIRISYAYSR